MKLRKIVVTATVLVFMWGVITVIVWACSGTPRPSCPRTAYLAKFAPETIVLPSPGAAISVPIGLIPYVFWTDVAPCAQPSGDPELTLEMTCAPVDGSASPVTLTSIVPTVTPGSPGPQTVAGPGGTQVLGGPFLFPVPAGSLTAAGPYECDVSGDYSVPFGAGFGTGVITGTGDTTICIAPPSPAPGDPVPEVTLKNVTFSPEGLLSGIHQCQRGDQVWDAFLLENNTDQIVDVTVKSRNRSVSGMPSGTDPQQTFFAISSPTPGTDAFAQGFKEDVDGLLDDPDPDEVSDREISKQITLAPWEQQIVKVAKKIFAGCADGSCNENTICASGAKEDGTPVLACSGSIVQALDNADPKTPLKQITAHLQASEMTDTVWSRIQLDDGHDLFKAGNLQDNEGGPGQQVAGPGFDFNPAQQRRFAAATDSLRLNPAPGDRSQNLRGPGGGLPTTATYAVSAFAQDNGFAQQQNTVFVLNLPEEGAIEIPLIRNDAAVAGNFGLVVDGATGQVTITQADTSNAADLKGSVPIYIGSLDGLEEGLPQGVGVDRETRFRYECDGSLTEIPSPLADPAAVSLNLDPAGIEQRSPGVIRLSFNILNLATRAALSWVASSESGFLHIVKASGVAGEQLQVDVNVADLLTAPGTSLGLITIGAAGFEASLLTTAVIYIGARILIASVASDLVGIFPIFHPLDVPAFTALALVVTFGGQFAEETPVLVRGDPAMVELEAYDRDGAVIPLPENPVRWSLPGQEAATADEIFGGDTSRLTALVGVRKVGDTNGFEIGGFWQIGTFSGSALDGALLADPKDKQFLAVGVPDPFANTRIQIGSVPGGDYTMTANLGVQVDYARDTRQGAPESMRTTLTIPPQGFVEGTINELFGDQIAARGVAQGQSALVELQGNDAVLFAKADLSAANSAVRGGSGTTTSVVFSSQTASGSTQLASPQLAGIPGVISSQIVLGNTASTSIRAELTVINDNGTSADMMTLQIPANSAVSTVFDGSTVDSSVRGASGLVGSLVIEASAPGLLGTVVFNTADAAAALPLQSAPFNEAVFAQVAELDDFFTGLALFNPPGPVQPGLKGVPPGTAQVTVTVLNPDGTQVGSSTVSLADGARMAQVVTELVSEAAGIVGGSIRLSSTEAIYAQVIFGRTGFLSVVPPIGLD